MFLFTFTEYRRFSVKLSTAGRDLRGESENFTPSAMGYDLAYDEEAAREFALANQQREQRKHKYRSRLINHPSFKNVTHAKVCGRKKKKGKEDRREGKGGGKRKGSTGDDMADMADTCCVVCGLCAYWDGPWKPQGPRN